LLAGLAVSVGVVASIPIYSSGALQNAFMRQWVTASDRRPPFGIMVSHWSQFSREAITLQQYLDLDKYLKENIEELLGRQAYSYTQAGGLEVNRFDPEREDLAPAKYPYADIRYMEGIENRVRITDGRWYSGEIGEDGVIEAVVDEEGLENLKLLVGENYVFWYKVPGQYVEGRQKEVKLVLKVVGTFRPIEEMLSSPEWVYSPPFEQSFFVDKELFLGYLIDELSLSGTWDWYWVFDYTKVRVHELPALSKALGILETNAGMIMPETRLWNSPQRLFDYFTERAKAVSMFLSAFAVPILGMVFYYIILTASLAVSRRRNEIAMLRSRGASFFQIILTFGLEWLLLGGVAYITGPFIGLGIAKMMGASAGFLSFVGRKGLPVTIVPDASRYGAYALGLAVLACLLPVFGASRHSIVTFKQEMARSHRQALWKRYLVDFLLLGASYYGYRNLVQQKALMGELGELGSAALMDPLLFFVPIIFLLGSGLLVLRLFPYAMAFLAWATNRLPGVCWPLTARHLARNSREYTPLLLLLIITVSLGIYSAAAARTLSTNLEDRILYAGGADVIIKEQWTLPTSGGEDEIFIVGEGDTVSSEPLIYEPPFYIHRELPGVVGAARVLTQNVSVRVGGNYRGSGQMMAIVPKEFGEVAWFRKDLAPHHFYEYLNALNRHQEGVLVSRQFLADNNLYAGDWIELSMKNQPIQVFVVAAIDYWPSLYPENGPIFITNLPHVQHYTSLEPYSIWLKMEKGAQIEPAVDVLREKGIWVTSVTDTRIQLQDRRHDPNIMGFFGVLSIGFMVSVAVTIMGFFLFTIWSLRARMLQFGVLRAIGLSVRQLLIMLALEQLFTVGVGLGAGTLLGRLVSDLFLPFIEQGDQFNATVPQFLIIVERADLMKIYIVLGSMLLVGIVTLVAILFRMRLADAVKLGEEV